MRVALEHVTKRFGRTTVVDDVSVEIGDGELFFLLGPSGCGKTTLLRCVAGFYVPEAGRVRIGEVDATRLPPHKRGTGMVFQSYALWPHMTVRENVAFGLEMQKVGAGERARRVDEALEMVRMGERGDARPNQLSGGQQQRVALARAMVIRPRCLLLDEPLSNLDAKLRQEMRGEIRRICKEAGLTAIYVTHDQKEALSVADRVAVIDRGRIAQCAAPEDLYRRPASRFVAHFIGDTNFLDGEVIEAGFGGVWVRTAAGRVLAAVVPGAPPRAGDRVTVSLRPEALRVGAPPADAPNAFAACVTDTVYLGEVAQRQVALQDGASGSHLKVYELNPRHAKPGDACTVWFDPADAVVLDAGEDA